MRWAYWLCGCNMIIQMREHIEHKMGYCACSYPLSGTTNLCAGVYSIWCSIYEKDNIHI